MEPSSRNTQLPSFSSAFGSLVPPEQNHSMNKQSDSFFIPSYLKGSIYAQKLGEARNKKNSAQNDCHSAPTSQSSSRSTNKNSANAQTKLAPSHRGMTYDLIEKIPCSENERVPPLPSGWSSDDKQPALEVLSDGFELKLSGQKSDREREHESCAARADYPMPSQGGIYYFEVTILARKKEESSLGIGFSSKKVPLTRLPGWEPESWAYHGDDGNSYSSQITGRTYGPPFGASDTIGCGINFRASTAFFTKNGVDLGVAFREVKGKLYPSVGMKKPGEHIRVNFGQSPFIFDIDGMMKCERCLIENEVKLASTSNLSPPLRETELIQALVLQFLVHDGYVETARAFATEIETEKRALNLDPATVIPGFCIKDDEDATHRQRIRNAVLDGDIDTALKYTNLHFPQVLKDNEQVYFRLRCRRFIEMIRHASEVQNQQPTNGASKKSDKSIDQREDINHVMIMDENQNHTRGKDQPEVEQTLISNAEHTRLLQEAIHYGTELSAEFKDDSRRKVKKALEDAFALIAYQEPSSAEGVAHLLDPSGRIAVAEELNSAILQSLGKSSSAALETLFQQTSVLLDDLREQGGSAAAFLNINDYSKPKMSIS
ncbi:BgtA-21027 [Blumeria graminis f. sp. tritici]|uniref:BgtA-21027 n=2 Tax=Blumeria graminis f. sp. tritici TaxID=62690 RepID=A0A9X9L8B3_BLUGR|nr:BgtA-21027 [Blumeria graminis f. sp. tritici]